MSKAINDIMVTEFNQIIEYLKNQQFDKVVTICRTLITQTNHPQLHLFLAIALGEKKDYETSTSIFNSLISSFPNNPEIHYNHAIVLEKQNKFNNALISYIRCTTLQPNHVSAWNNMGEIYRSIKESQKSIQALTQCTLIEPENITYQSNLAQAYFEDNQYSKSQYLLMRVTQSKRATEEDFSHLLTILISTHQYDLASKISNKALKQYNESSSVYMLRGLLASKTKCYKKAVNLLKIANTLKPNQFKILCHLSSAYMLKGNLNRSMKILDTILKQKTEAAYIFAITAYENINKQILTAKIINKGINKYPESLELIFLKSRLLRKEKKYNQCLNLINQTLLRCNNKRIQASLSFEKALCLDKLKQYESAWENINFANQSKRNIWAKSTIKKDSFVSSCYSIKKSFSSIPPIKIHTQKEIGSNLIFIVGFPRSGTTLLDSILSAHTRVKVLEEAPLIGEIFSQIKQFSPNNYAQMLEVLSTTKISLLNKLRKLYIKRSKEYIKWDKHNEILVDKSPLNTIHVGFIHLLFPHAKIIFSKRHPLDCSISCLFQDFEMNSFMTNLTSIQNTSKTYDAMLAVWKTSLSHMNIPIIYQSYEKLVSNFEFETKNLFDKLKLEWQNQILKYQDELSNRGAIPTPSYDQVNQPIYQTAKNRYKNYLPHLDEAIGILQPWIDHFGYKV